jgi:hypothetical protein
MDSTPTDQDSSIASSPDAGTIGKLLRVFNRIFTRHLMNIAILMMLPMLLAPTLNLTRALMVDPDIWFHLANARILCTTHHFIQVDPYSFTVLGRPWINYEWLSEIPYWFSFGAFGLRGIYLVAWLALCANILFVYWRSVRISRHAGAAFWATCIAIGLMTVNSGPRTIAFAYLALSAELAILEAAEQGQKRLLWLLPPLLCLWINLHGSWPLGITVLGIYFVCGLFHLQRGVFEQEAFTPRDRNRLLTVLVASMAAILINPYGWRLMTTPFKLMGQESILANLGEWTPLTVNSLEGLSAILAICLMIVANCIRGRKWRVYELGIILFAWYDAFYHHRFTYLAAVMTTPFLARDLERSFCTEPDTKTIPAMNAVMVSAAVWVMIFMFPTDASLRTVFNSLFPNKIISSLDPSWRTLNIDSIGGRLAFESKPTFIDTRFDPYVETGVLQDFQSIMYLLNPLDLIDKYRIDHILVKRNTSISYLLQHTPGWRAQKCERSWDGDFFVLYAKSPGAPPSLAVCPAPVTFTP